MLCNRTNMVVTGIVTFLFCFPGLAVDFRLLKADPEGLTKAMTWLEEKYPLALEAARQEATQNPAPSYWTDLARLATEREVRSNNSRLPQQRPQQQQQAQTVLSFAESAKELSDLTTKISTSVSEGKGVRERELVVAAFQTKRALVASNVLAEFIKRVYLLEGSKSRVSAADAEAIEKQLIHLHLWNQGTQTQLYLLSVEAAKSNVESMIELGKWIRYYAPAMLAGISGEEYAKFLLPRPFSLRVLTLPLLRLDQRVANVNDKDLERAASDLRYLSNIGSIAKRDDAQAAVKVLMERVSFTLPGEIPPAANIDKPLPPKNEDDGGPIQPKEKNPKDPTDLPPLPLPVKPMVKPKDRPELNAWNGKAQEIVVVFKKDR